MTSGSTTQRPLSQDGVGCCGGGVQSSRAESLGTLTGGVGSRQDDTRDPVSWHSGTVQSLPPNSTVSVGPHGSQKQRQGRARSVHENQSCPSLPGMCRLSPFLGPSVLGGAGPQGESGQWRSPRGGVGPRRSRERHTSCPTEDPAASGRRARACGSGFFSPVISIVPTPWLAPRLPTEPHGDRVVPTRHTGP